MVIKFDEVIFLEEASDFLETLQQKTAAKILYNIDLAKFKNDPELFKKIDSEIWEFRTKYNGFYYRLFAFWDKRNKESTIVIATHGIVKKQSKIDKSDIQKAKQFMRQYFKE